MKNKWILWLACFPLFWCASCSDDEKGDEPQPEEQPETVLLMGSETRKLAQVLQAMEPGEDPQRMSYSIRKDGTLVGDLANREQLKLLREYVFQVLAGLVEDIASGNVEPNPYTRGSSHSACDFCPYGTVCHKEQVEGRRNYKTMTAQRFWEEIEKERNRHGR